MSASSAAKFSEVGNLGGFQGTDWVSATISLKGSTSDPTEGTGGSKSYFWRRIGDSMEITWQFYQTSAGSNGSGTYILPLPSGYSIDTTKVTATTSGIGMLGTPVGFGEISSTNSSATNYNMRTQAYVYNSTGVWFNIQNEGTAGQKAPWGSLFYALGNATQYHTARVVVPILGWSAGGGSGGTGYLPRSMIRLFTPLGLGTVNTSVMRWTTGTTMGTALTWNQSASAASGDWIDVNETGVYGVTFVVQDSTAGNHYGIIVDGNGYSAVLNTNIRTQTPAQGLVANMVATSTTGWITISLTMYLIAGQKIYMGTNYTGLSSGNSQVIITQVSK